MWGLMKKKSPLFALVIVCILGLSMSAHAGNVGGSSDSFFMGNEAAIVGGAGLAITTDGGSAWVNPAGLALIPGDSLSLSASAFTVRRRAVNGIYSVDLQIDDEAPQTYSSDLDSTELMSVPSTIVRVWRIREGLGVGLGFFTPRSDVFASRHNLDALQGSYENDFALFSDGTEVTQLMQRYQLGPSVGWAVTPTFRLGFSAHVLYQRELNTWRGIHMDSEGSSFFAEYGNMAADNIAVEGQMGGVQLAAGFQWSLPGDIRVGAVVRSPVVQLYRKEDVDSLNAYLWVDETSISFDFAPNNVRPSPDGVRILEPGRAHVGVAIPWTWGWFALDGDIAPAFEDAANNVSFPLVWNVRAGARFKLGRQVRLGAGVFTDHSRYHAPQEFLQARMDFYGFTLGVQHLTRFQLGAKETSERLVLMSTLGFKWAAGPGQVMGQHVQPGGNEAESVVESKLHDATFYETSLHIGTGILF